MHEIDPLDSPDLLCDATSVSLRPSMAKNGSDSSDLTVVSVGGTKSKRNSVMTINKEQGSRRDSMVMGDDAV
jgi:hypothetical protein